MNETRNTTEITFTQTSEGEYLATDGVHTCRVIRSWRRNGGDCWEANVNRRTIVRGKVYGGAGNITEPTRQKAAAIALRTLRQMAEA